MDFLIPPHGGTLCRQLADPGSVERLKEEARATRAVVLSPRQISDLDLLLNGGFSPLRGFLGRADYESVLDTMRLESGLLWPIPVTLDVPDATVEGLCAGGEIPGWFSYPEMIGELRCVYPPRSRQSLTL